MFNAETLKPEYHDALKLELERNMATVKFQNEILHLRTQNSDAYCALASIAHDTPNALRDALKVYRAIVPESPVYDIMKAPGLTCEWCNCGAETLHLVHAPIVLPDDALAYFCAACGGGDANDNTNRLYKRYEQRSKGQLKCK